MFVRLIYFDYQQLKQLRKIFPLYTHIIIDAKASQRKGY